MVWADGSQFQGEWFMDRRIKGTMFLYDGTVYDGKFKNEMFDGKGVLTLGDKRVVTAMFDKGKCTKFAKV